MTDDDDDVGDTVASTALWRASLKALSGTAPLRCASLAAHPSKTAAQRAVNASSVTVRNGDGRGKEEGGEIMEAEEEEAGRR